VRSVPDNGKSKNAGSGLQCWRNLVEKVTAKKIDLTPKICVEWMR